MVETREASFSTLKLPILHKAAAAAATMGMDSPQRPSDSGISTPPLQTPASVPFKWEEEPGKPRLFSTTPQPQVPSNTNTNTKCLELPPACSRMLFIDNIDGPPTKTPSPTSVLDGPYKVVGRPKFSSFRFFREGHKDSVDVLFGSNKGSGTGGKQKARGRFFGKLRSGGKKVVDVEVFSSSEERILGGVGRKMARHGSFSGVVDPHATNNKSSSRIWGTIYQGLKQVVQWKSSRKPNEEAAALKEKDRSSPNFVLLSFDD
ncbi:hypothetical protein Salat_2262700 [Sesamum alatum]|uniref:Uncharacterized protein n=1 Tax=Sesamum alatum TaxID=300844 RepID=A0AAE1XVR8_9LAMI|nr:hypothetical protein Salat_2262700 [Sesamum alatum]